jgi:hypothetical protein
MQQLESLLWLKGQVIESHLLPDGNQLHQSVTALAASPHEEW